MPNCEAANPHPTTRSPTTLSGLEPYRCLTPPSTNICERITVVDRIIQDQQDNIANQCVSGPPVSLPVTPRRHSPSRRSVPKPIQTQCVFQPIYAYQSMLAMPQGGTEGGKCPNWRTCPRRCRANRRGHRSLVAGLERSDRGAHSADRPMKIKDPTTKTHKDPIGLRRNSYVCIHMYHEHFYIYVFYVSHRLLRTREPRVCAYTFACVMCCVCMTVILFLFCERW